MSPARAKGAAFSLAANLGAAGSDCLSFLMGVSHPNPNCDLVQVAEMLDDYSRHELFSIGSTCCSSLICIDMSIANNETVVYVDVADELDDMGMQRSYVVAPDIFAFYASLRKNPHEE